MFQKKSMFVTQMARMLIGILSLCCVLSFTSPVSARSTSYAVFHRTMDDGIKRTYGWECEDDHGDTYLKLWNDQSGDAKGVCFANAGTIDVHVYAVTKVTTGNNVASFTALVNGQLRQSFIYCKQSASTGKWDHIVSVTIYAPDHNCVSG